MMSMGGGSGGRGGLRGRFRRGRVTRFVVCGVVPSISLSKYPSFVYSVFQSQNAA